MEDEILWRVKLWLLVSLHAHCRLHKLGVGIDSTLCTYDLLGRGLLFFGSTALSERSFREGSALSVVD
jgi:hypothetical protein